MTLSILLPGLVILMVIAVVLIINKSNSKKSNETVEIIRDDVDTVFNATTIEPEDSIQ